MSMGGAGEEFTEINVTPLTDVFLVLLVIMILIAPLIDKSDLKIKPPDSKNAQKADESRGILIDIDKQGLISINSGKVYENADPQVLADALKDLVRKIGKSDVSCTLNADGDAREKVVVAVMQAASQAGIKHMRVSTVQQTQY
jgi:biopolymer transport protein ExbD